MIELEDREIDVVIASLNFLRSSVFKLSPEIEESIKDTGEPKEQVAALIETTTMLIAAFEKLKQRSGTDR